MDNLQPPTSDFSAAILPGNGGSPADLDAARLMEVIAEHGALMLRGFDTDAASFRSVAEALCPVPVFNESPDRRTLPDDNEIQTVNLGVDAFPLHPELSREPWRPDACFFGCFSPPPEEGQTTLCDGAAIVERLNPSVRAEMMGRQLLYVQVATSEQLQYWLGTPSPSDEQLAAPPTGCPYHFRRGPQQIIRFFIRPLLQPTRFGDQLAFANFLLFARDYLRRPRFPLLDDGNPIPDHWLAAVREAAEPITYPAGWQKGDILILDNSRFMHGRTAIKRPRERLIATYFGYWKDVEPMPGEPRDPIWRREAFKPPQSEPARVSS